MAKTKTGTRTRTVRKASSNGRPATKPRPREPVARTSAEILSERTEHLRELFPECFAEGRVDFNKLRTSLGEEVDPRPERFSFSWAGKRDAIRLLQTPSRATLVPRRKESINFDETHNLFVGMRRLPITIFSFGYWGWGTETERLVKMVDQSEAGLGFRPPLWVDIRHRRNGRAPGFFGEAFNTCVGADRYCWMQALGNRSVDTSRARSIRLNYERASRSLLDLALHAATEQRRVIFFCACPYRRQYGEPTCHRDYVTDLLIQDAKRIHLSVEVVEWPGGEPRRLTCAVKKINITGARKSLPLSAVVESAAIPKSLPYGSILLLKDPEGNNRPVIVGPARFEREWKLPMFAMGELNQPAKELMSIAKRVRRDYGFNPSSSDA